MTEILKTIYYKLLFTKLELLNEVGFFETIENLQLEECIFKEVKKLLVLQAVIIFARNFSVTTSSHIVC